MQCHLLEYSFIYVMFILNIHRSVVKLKLLQINGLYYHGFFYSSCSSSFPSSSFLSFPPFLLHVFSTSTEGFPTERQGLIHMSHQFTQIPIVFSHCAAQKGLLLACVSQHAFLYVKANAHTLTQLLQSDPSFQPHIVDV